MKEKDDDDDEEEKRGMRLLSVITLLYLSVEFFMKSCNEIFVT